MMESCIFSQQQKLIFNTFGFLKFPGLLSDVIEEITAEFEQVFHRKGKIHDGHKHTVEVPFIDQSEILSKLLDNPQIKAINSGILGDRYNYLNSAGNYYVGDTVWHSDVPLDPPWPNSLRSINFSIYLDPLTRDSGALRLIPGSHFIGDRFTDALTESLVGQKHKEQWGLLGGEIPAITVETNPGDVLVFNNYTKHASFGGGSGRRMLVLNFSVEYPDEFRMDLKNFSYAAAMLRGAGSRRISQLYQVLNALDQDGKLPELEPGVKEVYLMERKKRSI